MKHKGNQINRKEEIKNLGIPHTVSKNCLTRIGARLGPLRLRMGTVHASSSSAARHFRTGTRLERVTLTLVVAVSCAATRTTTAASVTAILIPIVRRMLAHIEQTPIQTTTTSAVRSLATCSCIAASGPAAIAIHQAIRTFSLLRHR